MAAVKDALIEYDEAVIAYWVRDDFAPLLTWRAKYAELEEQGMFWATWERLSREGLI